MLINAVICTRSTKKVSQTTDSLVKYFSGCGIKVYLLGNQSSIFKAYKRAYDAINPDRDDVIIFCHDDIEIRDNPEEFVEKIKKLTMLPETGFIGPAGTTHLSQNAVWWDQHLWKAGKHRGHVWHIDKMGKEYSTYYGEPDDVLALDGLFLAAKAKVIENVGLEKPEYFEGEWDFYDIFYTFQTYLKGLKNLTLPIHIRHESVGEIAGRDSWHENRVSFLNRFGTYLPAHITAPQ